MGDWQMALDMRSGVPIYRQIIDQVLLGIASRQLEPGDRLPTVRHLAVELHVNPNTVARAYHDLEIQGTLKARRGTGTFVRTSSPSRSSNLGFGTTAPLAPPARADNALRRMWLVMKPSTTTSGSYFTPSWE